jgi:rubrerythrin
MNNNKNKIDKLYDSIGALKRKEKEKEVIRDDFYDRVNYYESRNIFSTSDVIEYKNRLYTNSANNLHKVWDYIKKPEEENKKEDKEINELMKKEKEDNPIFKCKKCGFSMFIFI